MTGLEASTRYHYQVGDETFGSDGLSQVYSFKTAPDAATLAKDMPIRLAVYGDMGVDRNGSTVMRHLLKHLKRDADWFDGVVHVGDFAYDMEEREGVQGDLFMRQIEPIAARLPYMTSMGNHERVREGREGGREGSGNSLSVSEKRERHARHHPKISSHILHYYQQNRRTTSCTTRNGFETCQLVTGRCGRRMDPMRQITG
jgi:hypothetical protein